VEGSCDFAVQVRKAEYAERRRRTVERTILMQRLVEISLGLTTDINR